MHPIQYMIRQLAVSIIVGHGKIELLLIAKDIRHGESGPVLAYTVASTVDRTLLISEMEILSQNLEFLWHSVYFDLKQSSFVYSTSIGNEKAKFAEAGSKVVLTNDAKGFFHPCCHSSNVRMLHSI